jgi:hypothetical protein
MRTLYRVLYPDRDLQTHHLSHNNIPHTQHTVRLKHNSILHRDIILQTRMIIMDYTTSTRIMDTLANHLIINNMVKGQIRLIGRICHRRRIGIGIGSRDGISEGIGDIDRGSGSKG